MKQISTGGIFRGFCGIMSIALLASCSYYKPIAQKPTETDGWDLDSLKKKTIILHRDSNSLWLRNMDVQNNDKTFSGILSEVPKDHRSYLNGLKGNRLNYKRKNPAVLDEVHLYGHLAPGSSVGDSVVLPKSQINRMEVIVRDKKRSTTNTVIAGTAGFASLTLVFFVVLIIGFVAIFV